MEIKYNRTNAGHNAGKTFAIAIALFLINILKASALDSYQPKRGYHNNSFLTSVFKKKYDNNICLSLTFCNDIYRLSLIVPKETYYEGSGYRLEQKGGGR